MILVPKKRERARSGILRGPKLVWPKHDAFIRRHTCVVTLSKVHDECEGPIQACHYRTAANSGTGKKPPSWFQFPGCAKHHKFQHDAGQPAFERRFGLDILAICREMVRLSTDHAMRLYMRENNFTP